ncbi:interleukin-1 family member A [Nematolebias whitei]|uniref:interleukin-1 family member A n=1 Tax=Nematolebias whitei TaxID=451745 RepID=UPI00189880E6|nr:interleukin-1 family member A [Nematolebias whitei]
MDVKDSPLHGGVIISHQIHEGRHHYEVKKVMKYKKESGKKMFVRRGDKLMEINGLDLQNLTPEELAQQISAGRPMLTVHKSAKEKLQFVPEDDVLQPFSKETTVLSFSWEMIREEEEEEGQEKETNTDKDVCPIEDNGEDSDLLVITLTQTSISVVSGRGCNSEGPCQGCHEKGCTFKDVIMVSESSSVTLVPRGDVSLKQTKLAEVFIKHVPTHRFLRGICSDRTLYSSPNPEKISIYYYKSNDMSPTFRGMPVVLNLTGSNCFVRCCKEGNKLFLQTEMCEKQRLRQISKSDQCAFSFVFYMKGDRTSRRQFESALYKGWFIQIANNNLVDVAEPKEEWDSSFLFIIQM